MEAITESLADALERLDEFQAVTNSRPADQRSEALRCLWEAVGLDDDALALVKERVERQPSKAGPTGQVLFGVIAGLLAAEFDRDRRAMAGQDS